MKPQFFEVFLTSLLKIVFGSESLFVNTFINKTQPPLQWVLAESTFGDIAGIDLRGNGICFKPAVDIALTPRLPGNSTAGDKSKKSRL